MEINPDTKAKTNTQRMAKACLVKVNYMNIRKIEFSFLRFLTVHQMW